jgi:hypothetical protein
MISVTFTDNTNQVETGNINKIELPRPEAIHLLKLFDSDDFMRIKENTGKGAIRQFFVKGYKGLVNYQVSEGTCKTITKTIVEKVCYLLMNWSIIQSASHKTFFYIV